MGDAFLAIFNAFKEVGQSNEVPLKTAVSALLLYGIKEFVSDLVFSCPEEDFHAYGNLFIIGPAIFLLCLSLLASGSFWKVVTGCCLLTRRQSKFICFKAKNSIYVASMPPVIWLVYAFCEEGYYVCSKLGPMSAALAKANTTVEKDAVQKDFTKAKKESQVIAWALLLSLAVVSTVVVTIHRCLLPLDPKIEGREAFYEYEADEAVALFNERIKPLAHKDAKTLIDNLFEKNKDKNPEEQIKRGEECLMKLFPNHSGVLHGEMRNEKAHSVVVSALPDRPATPETAFRENGSEMVPLQPRETATENV